jgi:hypothetical protein
MKMWLHAMAMEKVASELTQAGREHIKPKNFAIPKGDGPGDTGKYPIHDEEHARNALTRVDQHGTPKEKHQVHAAVAEKYPGLAARSSVPGVQKELAKDKEGCGDVKMAAMREALDYQKVASAAWRRALQKGLVTAEDFGEAAHRVSARSGWSPHNAESTRKTVVRALTPQKAKSGLGRLPPDIEGQMGSTVSRGRSQKRAISLAASPGQPVADPVDASILNNAFNASRNRRRFAKTSGVLQRIASMGNPMSHLGEHAYDVGGLGVLAAPVADKLQAMARARLAGEGGDEEAIKRRQLISEPVGEAMELGGLGILAAPGIGQLAKGLRRGH